MDFLSGPIIKEIIIFLHYILYIRKPNQAFYAAGNVLCLSVLVSMLLGKKTYFEALGI